VVVGFPSNVMNAPERFFLPDIQASADHRQQAIDKVGVKGLRYPLALFDAQGRVQHTVAEVSHGRRPAARGERHPHVALRRAAGEEAPGADRRSDCCGMLDEMLRRLDADSGEIELAFPYFVSKEAPVSGVESLLDYDVRLRAEKRPGRPAGLLMTVVAPVTSLCPCSKKISDYGAHNQRSHITLRCACASR
jgi:GTP cyclohydrolase I